MESPASLFERLLAIPGYEWDIALPPYHSTYDNWHFYGVKADTNAKVVARVSKNVLRLEREFQLCKQILAQDETNSNYFVRPIELIKVAPPRHDNDGLAISIVEAPGSNYLKEVGNYLYHSDDSDNSDEDRVKPRTTSPKNLISLTQFLDFAIGATTCLEILHHKNRLVHGEIRHDAFHFNPQTGRTMLINFGAGTRSFENGLTSAGWFSFSREAGIEQKLRYISPEQTGRLPAQPDGRTDIYSLGVLFWTILTGDTPFKGETPMIIMQNVLSKRIPYVSSKRMDIPDALSAVIAKMTQKNIDNRYNSVVGLKHDLVNIRKLLDEGQNEAMQTFEIGTKDVSSYFTLPSHQIGRVEEREQIIKIMNDFCTKRKKTHSTAPSMSFHSSSVSDATQDMASLSESATASDAASQKDEQNKKESKTQSSTNGSVENGAYSALPSIEVPEAASLAMETTQSAHSSSLFRNGSLREGVADGTGTTGDTHSTASENAFGTNSNSVLETANEMFRKSSSRKVRSYCEVVSIFGSAGLGKSNMLHSLQTPARANGYFASAKFDQARKVPFEPLLRVISSLFRQIFSEADVSTPFHHRIRQHVGPVWAHLHHFLDLPKWMLNPVQKGGITLQTQMSQRRTSTTPSTSSNVNPPTQRTSNIASEWLKTGGTAKASRFMGTILGVLQIIASMRFVCLGVDDLQFADAESLELLSSIVTQKIPLFLVLTTREESQMSKAAKVLVTKSKKIQLKPFTDLETAEYVSATIHRDREYVVPLVAVIHEKTGGNPFFIRELLESFFRKGCISYSWPQSAWEYDLDKIFAEFVSDGYGSQMNNDFVTKRLQELPEDSITLLSWASLLGGNFSFPLAKLLMEESVQDRSIHPDSIPSARNADPIIGVQSALNAFIIMSTDLEDRFRFAHDRYMQAASSLLDKFDKKEMHYLIAKNLVDPRNYDAPWLLAMDVHQKVQHISEAAELLRDRVKVRFSLRQILYQAAENAFESGARPVAMDCLSNCLILLQPDPWNESKDDVYYQETLKLYIKAAENNWYQANFMEALDLVRVVYQNAKTMLDQAPCFIIESRVYARQGNNLKGFDILKSALTKLGLRVPDFTLEECDAEFYAMLPELENLEQTKLLLRNQAMDPDMEIIGVLLVELASTAFWSSSVLFYQIAILMIRTQLDRGAYPQCGLGHLHLASVIINRLGMVDFATQLAEMSRSWMHIFEGDHYTIGRGLTMHTLFISHLTTKLSFPVYQLSEAWNSSMVAGDRINALLNLGVNACYRIWSSQDLSDTEMFVQDSGVEFVDWVIDMRGGCFLVSARQFARALQGKTKITVATQIFDDMYHNDVEYIELIDGKSSTPDRQKTVYWTYKHIALFLFGHHQAALELGEILAVTCEPWLSTLFVYDNYFYLCLSYCFSIRTRPSLAERKAHLEEIERYRNKLCEIFAVNDTNYKAQILLIDAEVSDIIGDAQSALSTYEAALDHCQEHGFTLIEALVLELYANAMTRLGSRRNARRLLLDCQNAYRRISAHGKVRQIETAYANLFTAHSSATTAEAMCQTDIIDTSMNPYRKTNDMTRENVNGIQYNPKAPENADQIHFQPENADINGNGNGQPTLPTTLPNSGSNHSHRNPGADTDFSAMGLDMIDLTSILECSQILSSELQIDKLMGKMAEIITEISSADLVGIVIKDDQKEWVISAIGTPDGITTYPDGLDMNTVDADRQLALQVTVNVLRSRETVFVHNLLEDERFTGVSNAYMERYPGGKAVISLPIIRADDLLGAIYVEGPPNKFTERNLTVLNLLVNQISISLANALFLKRIEKVSAENMAMIGAQRKALARAREAETKAKHAEAEAIKNMHLKEEAAKAKSMFLANVSHELRTPLTGVIGMSELLKSTELSTKQAEYAKSIQMCADTLLSLINDLLDFTKLDAGKMKLDQLPVNVTRVIQEVVRALSYQNNKKGLQTIQQLELDPDEVVLADPVKLHQVMMNLLSNSYKFTSQGTVTVKAISEEETPESHKITVTVTDTGIGIPEEQRVKLFQPFTQVESTSSRAFQGTGLGLSICKRLVETLMGGKIWLESTPGVGTTVGFTITFRKPGSTDYVSATPSRAVSPRSSISHLTPQVTASAESLSSSEATEKPVALPRPASVDLSAVPRNDIRIAIAEDNPVNQKIAISFVQRMGFRCEAYGDGRKAVDALEAARDQGTPYHVVLMDVQMPNLDGYDATREIRRNEDPTIRNILIIAMTASAIQGDREKCLDAGMNDYLSKPVRQATLKALLDSYLNPPNDSPPSQSS